MGSLDRAKTLGGIGSILTLLGLVPFGVGAALVIIGWILVLIAIKYVSDAVQDRSIFNNAIIGAGLAMVGTVGLYIVGVTIFSAIGEVTSSNPLGRIGSIFQGLVLLWIVAIVSSVFLYMSFKSVATRLDVGLFSVGALVYIVGVALTIVLVGFIIAFIAQVLFAVAFFSLPGALPAIGAPPLSPSPAQTTPAASGTMTPAGAGTPIVGERRFCAKCGRQLDPGASFCVFCGARTNT